MNPHKDAKALPDTIDDFLGQRQNHDLLRIVLCGSVGDGKSTLTAHLLEKSQALVDKQPPAWQTDAGEQDRHSAVAYRYAASQHRQFILADTPGHAQDICHLVTAASTADVAVLLVDAQHGLTSQTRRHAYLCALMGIRHLALVINKMDGVRFHAAVYTKISGDFHDFATTLSFKSVTAIPLSALNGDNITAPSVNLHWYHGPTLTSYLDTVQVTRAQTDRLVFPVQWLNRPNASFWGLSGTLAEGSVQVGDTLRVSASGERATVAEIITMNGSPHIAHAGEPVTLRTDRELNAAPGDIIALANTPLDTTDQFEATVIWLHEEEGLTGRTYDIQLSTQSATASITLIKHRIDALSHDATKTLARNDISVCNLALSKPLVVDTYTRSKTLGSFILIDRYSHATVATGVISHSLRRAQNVHKQALSITRTPTTLTTCPVPNHLMIL